MHALLQRRCVQFVCSTNLEYYLTRAEIDTGLREISRECALSCRKREITRFGRYFVTIVDATNALQRDSVFKARCKRVERCAPRTCCYRDYKSCTRRSSIIIIICVYIIYKLNRSHLVYNNCINCTHIVSISRNTYKQTNTFLVLYLQLQHLSHTDDHCSRTQSCH